MEPSATSNGKRSLALQGTEAEPSPKRHFQQYYGSEDQGQDPATSQAFSDYYELNPFITAALEDTALHGLPGSDLHSETPIPGGGNFDFRIPTTVSPNGTGTLLGTNFVDPSYISDSTWLSSAYKSSPDMPLETYDVQRGFNDIVSPVDMWSMTHVMDPVNFKSEVDISSFRIQDDGINDIFKPIAQSPSFQMEIDAGEYTQATAQSKSPTGTELTQLTEWCTPYASSLPDVPKSSDCATTVVETRDTAESGGQTSNAEDSFEADTCFGVIVASPTSSLKSEMHPKLSTLTIKCFGNILKLYFKETNKYAGILVMPALCKLVQTFQVRLEATLILAKVQPVPKSTTRLKQHASKPHADEHSVRIVVFGMSSERTDVGGFLSDVGLHLQHPFASECEVYTEYANPHYLIRPGASMPLLEDLSLTECDEIEDQTVRVMDETTKSRVLHVFDLADSPQYFANVEPSSRLQSPLMDHQLKALAMMVEKESGLMMNPVFPSIWVPVSLDENTTRYRHIITGRVDNKPLPVAGGILADDMGLGKTLSILALICSSMDQYLASPTNSENTVNHSTLIVTPMSTLYGWQQQIKRHIRPDQAKFITYHGSDRQRLAADFQTAAIVLTTYETLRKEFQVTKSPIYSMTWYRLVLDEAHHIRNRSSQNFEAACQVPVRNRWCLTGTPIHNSLDDYGALLTFLRVPSFIQKKQFDYWIAKPMKKQMPHSLENLQMLVRATCLRRKKDAIGNLFRLPGRREKVEPVTLRQDEQDLYKFFEEKIGTILQNSATSNLQRTSGPDKVKRTFVLTFMMFLRRICNHGANLLPKSALDAWNGKSIAGDTSATIASLTTMKPFGDSCEVCGEDLETPEVLDSGNPSRLGKPLVCDSCVLVTNSTQIGDGGCAERDNKSPTPLATATSTFNSEPSSKLCALLKNLHDEQASNGSTESPIKSVVFTSWTEMIDLIEIGLRSNGFTWRRIDGKTNLKSRSEAMSQFNEDPKCTVMVASIGSAGEGVDFTVANHVHIIEPHWNPMAEAQAVDRVHRIGQTRPVMITKYIVTNSVETYIQWVQKDKLRLIAQSIDFAASTADTETRRMDKLREFLNV